MPGFEDYHRTIVGYHGTLRETALKIVSGEKEFNYSKNDDDWLGHGVYFWEYAPKQAIQWAERRYKKQKRPVAVLGAMIRLGRCFDLLDPTNAKTLKTFNRKLVADMNKEKLKIPKNVRAHKRLDCLTLNAFYGAVENNSEPNDSVDTCRAVYVPTQTQDRLWEQSWLYQDTHIQLCVRNTACILGVWMVHSIEETD